MHSVAKIIRPLFVVAAFAVCGQAAPSDYAFAVDISLSPQAAAQLRARGDTIEVIANYSGQLIPSKMSLNPQEGTLDLGTESVTIPGAGRAAVTGTKVMADQANWVTSITVLISVSSTHQGSSDDLLDCGLFTGTLAKARAAPIAIACH